MIYPEIDLSLLWNDFFDYLERILWIFFSRVIWTWTLFKTCNYFLVFMYKKVGSLRNNLEIRMLQT